MTKLCIIDVDLGANVEELITQDVAVLTGQAEKELETAIASARDLAKIREERRTADDNVSNTVETAYQSLLAAGPGGVAVAIIWDSAKAQITTQSALTLRLKSWLKKLGNPYVLNRIKKDGEDYFVLTPFNIAPPAPSSP